MEKILNAAIVEILLRNLSLMQIAVRQKAKFEGWLKFELANYLMRVYPDTRVEYKVNNVGIVDIYSNESLVELKTPNTNYKVGYCERHRRPITKNVQSICDDIAKLKRQTVKPGYIAFVMFPIDDHSYTKHVDRIKEKIAGVSNGSNPPVETVVNVCGVNVLVFTARVC